MGYGLDSWGSIPAGEETFLYSTASRPALVPIQPPTQWVPGTLSLGAQWMGRQADHSPTSSAEAKNAGTIPPLPHVSLWNGAELITYSANFTLPKY
jgi:hypothetical protein